MTSSVLTRIGASGLPGRWLMGCLAALFVWAAAPCPAEEKKEPVRQPVVLVSILQEDHQGERLRFPSVVAFDQEQEEIYVLSGGKKGFVIYDSNLFPHLFLGPGRGLDAPQGIFFHPRDGRVFVCQGRSASQPPRLTILNGAFIPVGEILIADMPEAETFSPSRGVVGKNGNIYLAGAGSPGVLVLNHDGGFLRWLRPLDSVRPQEEEEEPGREKTPEQKIFPDGTGDGTGEESEATGDNPLGLPEELLPRSRLKAARASTGSRQGPVMINDIIMDRDGHLFLLSEETSKVYVYTAGEEFLFSFGQKGGSSGKMSRPRGLAMDEARKSIYIVDYMRHTIMVYDTGGKYLFEFGGRGTGPLWFNFPNSISVDRKGQIIIADLFNSRVQILRADFDVRFPMFQGLKTPPSATETPRDEEPFSEEQILPEKNE